jgi:hypothetical protein
MKRMDVERREAMHMEATVRYSWRVLITSGAVRVRAEDGRDAAAHAQRKGLR